MESPLTPDFVRTLHPLPISDRRKLLQEMGVEDVDHRDDASFYSWLAERYRRGETPLVDAALRHCCAKADERISIARVVAWLAQLAGRREPSSLPSGDRLAALAAAARANAPDSAAIIDALAPAFGWPGGTAPPDATEAGSPAESAAAFPAANDGLPEVDIDPGAVADRLAKALRALAAAPDRSLLIRADDLAGAIEAHLGDAQRRAERDAGLSRAIAAIDALGAEDREGLDLDPAELPIETLAQIAAAAEAVAAARQAVTETEAAYLSAVRSTREARRAADDALSDAVEALRDAQAELRALALERESPLAAEPDEPATIPDSVAAPVERAAEANDPVEQAPPSIEAPPAPVDGPPADVAIEPPAIPDQPPAEPPLPTDDADAAPPRQSEDAETGHATEPAEASADEPVVAATPAIARRWSDWIATALGSDRVGLAFHLATARDLAGGGGDLPAVLLEAVVRSRAIQAAFDTQWHLYEGLRAPLLAAARSVDNGAAGQACALLLAAGALRPALTQSVAAIDVLDAIGGDIGARLNPLRRLLGELRGAGIGRIDDIAAPAGEGEHRRRATASRAALERWQREAPNRTTNYAPAIWIWQALVGNDGAIGRVVAAVIAGKPGARDQALALSERLGDPDTAKLLIAEADNTRPGRRHNAIEGGALKQLLNLCAGIAELLAVWLHVEAGAPDAADRHRPRRGGLLRELRAAEQVAVGLAPSGGVVAVAATLFAAVARDLSRELEGGGGTTVWPADDELALLPDFPLNARVAIRVEPDDVPALEQAADTGLGTGVPSAAAAFARALALENASAATRLLDHLPADTRPRATADLGRMIDQARDRLAHRARALRQSLDDLQIAWDDADRLPDAIEREMSSFEEAPLDRLPLGSAERGGIADFPAAHRRLDEIERRLDTERAPVAARLAAAVGEQEERLGEPLAECRELLAQGDLGTLAETVVQIRKHGLSRTHPTSLVTLLHRFADAERALGERPAIDLLSLRRAAAEGRDAPPFDFSRLARDDRGRADRLLSSWINLKRAARPGFPGDMGAEVRKAAIEMMTALGFTGVKVGEVRRERAWIRIVVSTDPLRDRARCLAPAFGSEANGRYVVAVIPDDNVPSALSLFDQLPEQVILLATEALAPRFRRDLQRAARAGTRSVALADLVTMATLASEPEAGTRAFFDLALPYGAARPYADTSAQTSKEMFFGREREYRDLVDPKGACLVYGGRQLGKTALLKQIELSENVGSERVAIYCDIRPVGDSRPADEVWLLIEEELKKKKVELPAGRTVADRLRAWAAEAPGRYLLILLDEADHFLDSEMGADFEQIGRMKALMDDTRRTVKFVLAGLHNVQRFHRAPNSPFLHLGKSVNVGPLLGEDREAARQMALEPMAALGIAFDKRVDAAHMLSLVGYYPSLMQSFGKAVVRAVDTRLKQPGDGVAMPFPLDRKLIGDCFEQQAFRAEVVNRFQYTLQLDERYELITYAVWQRAMQDVHEGRPAARGGYPASAIREMADYWWPAGFRDTDSPDSFTAILDEMVEMGVLAREGERYALRSQRIAAMLGSKAEIEDALESFGKRVPKKRADPMISHRRMNGIWSPLSLRQEATLRERLERSDEPTALVLIGASTATGGEDLADAIRTLAANLQWPEPRDLAAQPAHVVLDVVKKVKREARPQRPKLVLVHHAWPTVDEVAALRRHRVLRDPHQPVRVVYCGAPTAEVLALPDAQDWLRLMLGPLPLETMAHWLHRERLPFAASEEVQRDLRHATGGLIHLLDGIKLPLPAERQDPDRLLARARATTLPPADLGLDDDLAAFARDLRDTIDDGAFTTHELAGWAVDKPCGHARLALLRALGIVEPVPNDPDRRLHALNPAAFRALA